MAEQSGDEVKEEEEEEEKGKAQEEEKKLVAMSRKEKKKEKKKMKRKQLRRGIAEKEREEEERKLNDPEEQRRAKEMEEEEMARMDKERKEFEESERKWMEAMERKRKEEEEESRKIQEEEEEAKRLLFQSEKENDRNEDDGGDDWEYVEEGPAEIIWQGNEITVRKKKVRVPKKNADRQSRKEDDERPTSNPLPPQSEAFVEYQNELAVSAQQMLENVAQQVPNFGTEQDKAHCPFHLKTGACRFGLRCSRVHFYPDKACTLLIKNMYNGPGLAWEHDEGLEYTDEEVECSYEEFYEDVHTEFLKYGEIVNFKVCKNGSSHLRGNVYVHYKSLESAVLAYQSLNGRYFGGKQVKCEFVSVTKWKIAICGEYMRSRLKTCSHGTACNFIHCFRNPGGDYEWADWDKPPPRYWMKKMASLFGYSHDSVYEKQMEQEKLEWQRVPSKMLTLDRNRHHRTSRTRSRSRDMGHMIHRFDKNSNNEDDVREGTFRQRHADNPESNSEGGQSDRDREIDRDRNYYHARKRSRHHSKASEHSSDYGEDDNRYSEIDPNEELADEGRNRNKHYDHTKSSGLGAKRPFLDVNRGTKNDAHGSNGYQLEKHHDHLEASSRHQSKGRSPDDLASGKSRMLDVEPSREWSRGDRDKNHHRISERPRNQTNVLELPDDPWENRSRTDGADSSVDLLERDRGKHCSRGRKRLRHHEPEFSYSESAAAKRLREKSLGGKSDIGKAHLTRNPTGTHSTMRNCLSRENADINYPESLRPDVNHEHGNLKQYSGRCESCNLDPRSNSIEETDDLDRWEPESPERDRNSRRKSTVGDGYESGGQCDTRSEFHDANTSYSNKKMDREGAQEYEKDASEKYPGSRSEFTFDDDKYGMSSPWDENSVKLCNESRSRDSSHSTRKRHSKRVE